VKSVKNIQKKNFVKLLIISAIIMTSTIFLTSQSFAQTAHTPDQPLGFTAIAISPMSISLNWSPPQNNGGSPITGYKIDYKIVPSTTYTNLATLGNVTTFTHINLITGKTYIYRVSAINSNGTGIPSPEALVTPTSSSAPPKNIAPNPPQSLTALVYSSTQVNLSWSAPSSNGGPPVTGYKIQYITDTGNFTDLISNSGSSFTAYSHTGLQVGHIYIYRIFAINSIGTSNSSNTASATIVQVNTVPGSPTLSVNPSSATSISLLWSTPNDGGSAITGYKIEYSNTTSQYNTLVANTGNTQTSYLHKGLTTGQIYTYRVTAINAIGMGNPSNTASAQPKETTTPSITNAVAISPTSAGISWIAPSQTYGQIINGYRIDQVINGNFLQIDNVAGSVTTYTIPNLITGKTYTFAVTALLSGGSSTNPSPLVSVSPTSISSAPSPSGQPVSQNPQSQQNQVLPDSPSIINATMISQNTVKISWLMPSNNGKLPITGFNVESKTGSTGTWSTIASNIGVQTSFVKSGLQADITYFYRVSSISNAGTSQPSAEAHVNTSSNVNQAPTAPVPPTILQSQGIIPVVNTTLTISYQSTGGQILGASINPSTFSLKINLKANTAGTISIQIPREMIDAKKLDGTDDTYIVTADKSIASFNETKSSFSRILVISFPANTNEISIYGTTVIPEFPIALMAFIISFSTMIIFSRRIIK
jgi:fibronectin type 3 domain-containing protein